MWRALLPVVVACSAPAAPAVAPGPLPLSPLPIDAPPPPPPTFVDDVIVVEASGLAAYYHSPPIRSLRRVVAARHGKVEVSAGFGEIQLIVSRVVSGPLFDPDYATRPFAANRLSVMLVDEAGRAATTDGDRYKGTWHLTQLADGTLVAASLADTPFSPPPEHDGAWVANTRASLRSQSPARRGAALRALGGRHAYELVPDVIALLDDHRRIPGNDEEFVADTAESLLDGFAGALGEEHRPDGRSADVWTKLWAERFTQVDPLPVVVPSKATEHVRVFSHQTWPQIAMSASGVVVGVTYLEHDFDGNPAGIFVAEPATRRWISREVFERLQVSGAGMIWADPKWQWHFATTTGAATELPEKLTTSESVALATAGDGFLVLGIDRAKHVQAIELDVTGKQRRATKLDLRAMAGRPESIFVAPRADGWLAVLLTDRGIVTLALDERLRVRKATNVATRGVPATIAVGRDRAFVAWNIGTEIESLVTDLDGAPVGEVVVSGDFVSDLSAPIALDDGFALAWVEDNRELHLGRFDRAGTLVSNVVVQANHVAPYANVSLARDRDALLVTYLDVQRYPYTVVTRRP